MKRAMIALIVACVAGVGIVAAADEHVTVPAPLGQQNKEAVVQPGATLKQASCGRVLQGEPAQRPARTTAVRAGSWAPSPSGSGEGFYVPPSAASNSGPTGPALVEAAYLTLRGTVASFDKGVAVTIVDRNGRSRTVPLARGARVDDSLKAGDLVAIRIPLEDDPANKAANRVERQKPAAPAAPKSKFAQAQAAAN
jgi:hypothetical protein